MPPPLPLCRGTQHGHPLNGRPPPRQGSGNLVRKPDNLLYLVADPYSPRRGWVPLGNTTFPPSNSLVQKTRPTMGTWDPQLGPNPMSRSRRPPAFPRREIELQCANPSLQFPLPKALTLALKYIQALLSSKYTAHWQSLCLQLTLPQGLDYQIAPRWRTMLDPDWGSLPDKPSPLAVDRASSQLSIARTLS